MKKAIIAGFALLIIGCLSNGCESPDELEFSEIVQTKTSVKENDLYPIGVIPNWAKEKLPAEIYEKIEIMSKYFIIDYAFLRNDITPERWEEIKYSINSMCQQIQEGKISKEAPAIFAIASEQPSNSYFAIEQMEMLEPGCVLRGTTLTVYKSQFGPSVKISCTYHYNTNTKAVSNIECTTYATSYLPAHSPQFQGSTRTSYDGQAGVIVGICVGTLSFNNGDYTENENVSKDFSIIP